LKKIKDKKVENLDVSGFGVPVDQKVCLVSINSDEDNIIWRFFIETTKQLVGNSVGKHLRNEINVVRYTLNTYALNVTIGLIYLLT
jgi:hypothetical protein